ncbi:MAG: phage tail tape measure protein [Candidatus Sedimenticola sp. (ex Thyasira tokunagai)]
MADVQKTIEIIFGAVDNTGGGLQSVGKGLDDFSSKAQQVTGPIAGVTTDILKLEAGFALAGAAVLAFSYDKAATLQSAMLDLQKVLGDGEGNVDQYRARLEALSDQYGVSAVNTIQAAADFKQAGFSIEEALGLVETSLISVKISELDATQSSDLMIASLKGFGAEASESSRYLDVLNAISNQYATSLGELAIGVAELSPVANSANLSFEQTAAILTPAIEVFRSGAEAGTAFKTVLLKLVDDSKPVQQALEDIGVSQRDANGVMKSAGDILFEVMGKWDGVTESEQLFVAQQLVGIHQAGKFLAVMNDSAKVLAVHETALNANGSAAVELEIRLKAAEETVNRTKVAFENAAISIGERFLPEASGVVDATGDMLRAFKELVNSGGFEPLFDILRPLLSEFEADLRAMAVAMPEAFELIDWSSVTGGLDEVGRSISDLFDGVDVTTPEGLASAIQKLIDTGGSLLQVTAGIIDGLKPFIDALVDGADAANDVSGETKRMVGELFGAITAVDKLLPLVSYLGDAINVLGIGIGSLAFSNLVKGSGSAATAMGSLSGIASALPAILGKAGLAGAVGYLVYEFGRWADLNDRLVPGVDTLGTKLYDLIHESDEVAEAFSEQAAALASEERGLAEVIRLHGELKEMLHGVSDEEKNLIDTKEEMSSVMDQVNKKLKEQGVAWNEGSKGIQTYTEEVGKTKAEIEESKRKSEEWVEVVEEGGSRFLYVGKMYSDSIDKVTDATDDAIKKSEEFQLKWEEIASNERIKTIEASVELNIAELEAQTKTVETIFESLNTTISSTGDVISAAFAPLADLAASGASGASAAFRLIEAQMEAENENRQRALEQQMELIRAETENMNTKTQLLRESDGLIKIEAAGLEPELEAFMYKILKRIQIHATQEGAEFLLGVS